jgi:hypothetical protein
MRLGGIDAKSLVEGLGVELKGHLAVTEPDPAKFD